MGVHAAVSRCAQTLILLQHGLLKLHSCAGAEDCLMAITLKRSNSESKIVTIFFLCLEKDTMKCLESQWPRKILTFSVYCGRSVC